VLLKEVLEHLSYGELSQLTIGGSTLGSTDAGAYPQIVSYINLGLMDLYKKFLLSEKEVIIQQFANINEYIVDSANSVSDGSATYQYVRDSVLFPFENDLLKIENVFDEEGTPLPLNDCNDDTSVFTTRYDTLYVQSPNDENALSVIYRAAPVKLSTTSPDPDTMEIFLPDVLLTALLAFIGHRVHKPLSGETNRQSSDYLGTYLALCAEADLYGSTNKDQTDNHFKFSDNGWV